MVNEVLQWALLSVLALLVLGVLRQVSLMLPPGIRAAPSGPGVGERMPRELMDEVNRSLGDSSLDRGAILAFVTENCPGCQQLLGMLPEYADSLDGQPLVLVAKMPSQQFREALAELRVPTIHDDRGELWRIAEVTGTPLLVRVDSTGRVWAKEVTHRVDLVASMAW